MLPLIRPLLFKNICAGVEWERGGALLFGYRFWPYLIIIAPCRQGYATLGVIPVSKVLKAQTAWVAAHAAKIAAQIGLRLVDLYLRRASALS